MNDQDGRPGKLERALELVAVLLIVAAFAVSQFSGPRHEDFMHSLASYTCTVS